MCGAMRAPASFGHTNNIPITPSAGAKVDQSASNDSARPRVGSRSHSECDDAGKCEGRQEVASEFVVARCDASEAFEAAEGIVDQVPVAVAAFVVEDRLRAFGAPGDDRRDVALAQVAVEIVCVSTIVRDQGAGRRAKVREQQRHGTDVGDVAGGECDGDGSADDVHEPVELGRRADARTTDARTSDPPRLCPPCYCGRRAAPPGRSSPSDRVHWPKSTRSSPLVRPSPRLSRPREPRACSSSTAVRSIN